MSIHYRAPNLTPIHFDRFFFYKNIAQSIIGSILILGMLAVLYINEMLHLQDLSAVVHSVSSDNVMSSNDNQLVHVSGNAVSDEKLTDPDFNLTVQSIQLIRDVKMYQWVQAKANTENTTHNQAKNVTYSYYKDWVNQPINSILFREFHGHENPATWPYKTTHWDAKIVHLGNFVLQSYQIAKIAATVLPVNLATLQEKLPDTIKAKLKQQGSSFFLGEDPQSPQIGDLMITFYVVPSPSPVTVIAKQVGNSFATYYLQDTEKPINLFKNGIFSADDMFGRVHYKYYHFVILLGPVLLWLGLFLLIYATKNLIITIRNDIPDEKIKDYTLFNKLESLFIFKSTYKSNVLLNCIILTFILLMVVDGMNRLIPQYPLFALFILFILSVLIIYPNYYLWKLAKYELIDSESDQVLKVIISIMNILLFLIFLRGLLILTPIYHLIGFFSIIPLGILGIIGRSSKISRLESTYSKARSLLSIYIFMMILIYFLIIGLNENLNKKFESTMTAYFIKND